MREGVGKVNSLPQGTTKSMNTLSGEKLDEDAVPPVSELAEIVAPADGEEAVAAEMSEDAIVTPDVEPRS